MVLPKSPSRTFSLDYLRQTFSSLKSIVTNRNIDIANSNHALQLSPAKLHLTLAGRISKSVRKVASGSSDDEDEIDDNSNYQDFKTVYEEFENQLNQIQPTLDDLLLSIDLNVNCVCSSVVFDVTVLECGHIFCRNCIKTWTTSHKKRCPYCRVMTNAEFSSEQIEELLAELDLIQIRYIRFSRMIEYANEVDTKNSFHDSTMLAETKSTVMFKCWKIENYHSLVKYLFSRDYGFPTGEGISEKYFPEALYTHRGAQVKYNRRKDFCWPWANESFRRDIVVTFGLYLLTFLQLWMFSTAHGRISDWTWTEFAAAAFIYVWSGMCFTYFIMLVR